MKKTSFVRFSEQETSVPDVRAAWEHEGHKREKEVCPGREPCALEGTDDVRMCTLVHGIHGRACAKKAGRKKRGPGVSDSECGQGNPKVHGKNEFCSVFGTRNQCSDVRLLGSTEATREKRKVVLAENHVRLRVRMMFACARLCMGSWSCVRKEGGAKKRGPGVSDSECGQGNCHAISNVPLRPACSLLYLLSGEARG